MNIILAIIALVVGLAGALQLHYWLDLMMPPELYGMFSGVAGLSVAAFLGLWIWQRRENAKEKAKGPT